MIKKRLQRVVLGSQKHCTGKHRAIKWQSQPHSGDSLGNFQIRVHTHIKAKAIDNAFRKRDDLEEEIARARRCAEAARPKIGIVKRKDIILVTLLWLFVFFALAIFANFQIIHSDQLTALVSLIVLCWAVTVAIIIFFTRKFKWY